MNSHKSLARLLVVVCLLGAAFITQRADSSAQEKAKAGNDLVKISSACTELADVKADAEKCNGKEATSIRLKVNCDSPVDVRVSEKTWRGRWISSDHLSKKRGDEITAYQCYPKAQFKVQTRPAGSNKPWSN